MPKTFTLPKILSTKTNSLCKKDPVELLYQSRLMNFLSEEFEEVSFSPKQAVVNTILAYSKAVEVKKSEIRASGHVIMMN